MQVEIVDPDNESLTPGTNRVGEAWTVDRTRKESLATILAACWFRQPFTFLKIEFGRSKVMTTFRWDLFSHWVMISQEPTASAMLFEKGKAAFSRVQQ